MNLSILSEIAIQESHRIYGENNYSFALGYFKGYMDDLLYSLDLTKEQEAKIKKFLDNEERKLAK